MLKLCLLAFSAILISKVTSEGNDLGDSVADERQDVLQEFVANHYSSSSGFLYTNSPLHFMHLAKLDRLIFSELKEYQKELKKRLDLIKSYIKDFRKTSLRPDLASNDDPEHWRWAVETSSNPIGALRVIRRMTEDLPKVLESIESGKEVELIDNIYVAKDQNRLDWPAKKDLEVITNSLIDIPNIYGIPVIEIADGHLSSGMPVPLSAAECNEIGSAAFFRNRFASAVQWMDAAKHRLQIGSPENIPSDLVAFNWKNAVAEHDIELLNFTETQVSGERPLSSFWDQDIFVKKIHDLGGNYAGQTVLNLYTSENPLDTVHPTVRYWSLCAGANFQSPRELQQGHCFHSRRFDLLVPTKVEILNRFPLVLLVHDIIDSSTNLALITEAMSQIEAWNGIEYQVGEQESRPPIPATVTAPKFHSRVKTLKELTYGQRSTNVILEKLHVSVYSFASGDATLDKIPDYQRNDEDSQATLNMHVFLNTMDHGGRTVFPRLGFGVKPERNSAVIWSQFQINGVSHPDLFWTNCPIISGNKWVASNYIRAVGRDLGFGSEILNGLKR